MKRFTLYCLMGTLCTVFALAIPVTLICAQQIQPQQVPSPSDSLRLVDSVLSRVILIVDLNGDKVGLSRADNQQLQLCVGVLGQTIKKNEELEKKVDELQAKLDELTKPEEEAEANEPETPEPIDSP